MNPIANQTLRASALALGFAAILAAQPAPFSSTAQVKAACEAPGNTIFLTQPAKVHTGAPVSAPQVVNSRCRIVLSTNGKLEIDGVGLRFNGPVTVQSVDKGEFSMKNALLTAPSAAFDFGGETKIVLDESQLVARAGDLSLRFGALSELTITKPLSGRTVTVQASGSILVSGGAKLATSISETTLSAGDAISWSSTGNEGSLTAQQSAFVARGAGVTISSPGAKSHLDFASSRINAANGITINYSGREAQISFDTATLAAGIGGVYLAAGDNNGELGVVKLVGSTVNAQGGVDVRASVNALKGETVVEISRINAGASVNVETGLNGVTSVKLNRLVSPLSVRAVTGPSGACIAEGNTVRSPVQDLCR
jgi:hypothetical protein